MPVVVAVPGLAAEVAGLGTVTAGLAGVWAFAATAADAKRRSRTGCFMTMGGSKRS